MSEDTIQELQDKLFDAQCEIEDLKAELAKYKKPVPKKLSEVSNIRVLEQAYINELPENVLQIDEYGGRQFDRYYYDYENERVIMRTATGKFKVVNDMTKNSKYITMSDVDGQPKSCLYSKLIRDLKKALEN